jgi:PKD repeat protein
VYSQRSRLRCLSRPLHHRLMVLGLILVAFTGNAFGGSVNLGWDPIAGASGYSVAYGTTTGTYGTAIDVGSNTSTTISGLTEGTRYYFTAQAYSATLISVRSNEVSTVVAPATTEPVASFTANGSGAASLDISQGQTVNFVDTSTGTVASRSWDLGDGTTATTASVVKSYTTTGAKTVVLSVTGAGVTKTASKLINVAATTAAPVADFSASPLSGTAPLAVTFTDASSGSITSYAWSFGNGATSTTPNPTTTYSAAGTYTVSLSVSGSGGSNTATKTGYITVSESSGGGGGVDPTGLVAAYGFDETGGTQALDSSGRGNHGTLSNATRSSQAKFGRALSFNGSNSLVTVADSAALDLTNGMTLSAWVYPTSWASGWKTVIMKERSGGLAYTLNANSDAGRPNTTLRIGSYDRQLTAGSHLPTNTWAHLAATYNGSRQRLFVNGVQVGSRSQTGNLDVTANPVRIGGSTVWPNQYFQGLIDEVRVYNRALTRTEIAAVAEQPVVKETSACSTSCSLWDETAVPSIPANSDPNAVELGVKIRSDMDGFITAVRFYKGTPNTGPHVGRLWTSSGQLLAQTTFTNETASGWQQADFSTPVAIKANTIYVVSYHAPAGGYAYDEGYFAASRVKPPLRAPASTEIGGNGVYRYGSGGVFPTNTYNFANYWVDAVFKTQ